MRVLSIAVVGLLVLAVAFCLWAASAVFIPIAFAVLLSYAVQPVQRLLARRLPGTVAAAVVVLAMLASGAWAVYGLRSQVSDLVASLPDAFQRVSVILREPGKGEWQAVSQVRQAARKIEEASATATQAPPAPRGVTRVQVEAPPFSFTDLLWRNTGGAITFAGQVLVVIVLVFYFLAADDLFKRKLVKIAGTRLAEKRLTVEILNDIERHIGRYLAARLLISVIVCIATAAAFWALDMPQPAAWGIVAGVLNVVPFVGPTVVTIAASIAAFLHSGSPSHAVAVLVVEGGINTVEGFVLTPVLMGKAGRMSGAAVFIALTVWGFLWGLAGLLLAVPITMAVKVLCDRVDALAPIGELLGD